MDADVRLDRIARQFAVALAPGTFDESRSASHVRRAHRADGTPVIVKITHAADGAAREAAERELAFYREVAPGLPIRTPALLDHDRTADGLAILLTAHEAIVPPQQWRPAHWIALARDLATLHQTPMPTAALWQRDRTGIPETVWALAGPYWTKDEELATLIAPLLDDPGPLQTTATEQPTCFGHGDCHSDNLLISGDTLIWADWQEAGSLPPAGDLAFPSVRATPSGAVLPLPEMIKEYAGARRLDPAALERSVLAAELSLFLAYWPMFAGYNTAVGNLHVHRRVLQLTRRWSSG